MATPYKMKGSPMQRNFGISPVKQNTDKKINELKEQASNQERAYKSQVGDGDPRSSKTGAVQEMQRQFNIYDRQRGKKVTYANTWKGMGAVERKKHNNDYDTFENAAKIYNAEKSSATKKIGKRTVEKLPEGGKRVRVTDKEGRVKKEVIKGKGYRGVTKFDKQGREVVSKSRSGSMLNPERKSKTKTSYQDDFSNKKSEVKLTTKERGKKKKVIKAKYKKDNRDFFPG